MAYPQCSRLLIRLALVLLCSAAFLSLTLPILASNPGDLDPTFGNDGVVTTTIGSQSFGRAVVLQPDGKIVVAGYSGGSQAFALARYNSNGNLDDAFGNGGIVTTTIGYGGQGNNIILQSDGKIVVAGYSSDGFKDSFTLARYTITGTLDNEFGKGGVITTPIGNSSATKHGIAIQSDSKIVMAGYHQDGSQQVIALTRHTITGSLDSNFGNSGIVTTSIGSNVYGRDVAVQPDGKILVTGSSDSSLVLICYTNSGDLDNIFGKGGIVTTSIGSTSWGEDVVLQSDGKILVAGTISSSGKSTFALVRYTITGSLDSTFGSAGVVTTSIGSTAIGWAAAVQPNNKIVVTGPVADGIQQVFGLVRYNGHGSLDTTFGNNGIVTTTLDNYPYSLDVAVQPDDGRILVIGQSGLSFALARYLGDTPNPTSIPPSGGTIYPTPGVTFTASSGIFSDTVLITYTPQPITSTGSLSNVGLFFKLDATYLSNGQPAQPQPGQHYTIKVTYRQEDVPVGMNEADLALYYWDGAAWVKEPSSVVDTSANTITASPDRFSLWAALAAPSSSPPHTYLPLILKP
ncbi:MAG: hypothetical protein BroJett011_34900 [Chloroflexota bacterium]|nr:MAG: hypothetical protein BroJett011_34900 [Chloroflexota bacterium]